MKSNIIAPYNDSGRMLRRQARRLVFSASTGDILSKITNIGANCIDMSNMLNNAMPNISAKPAPTVACTSISGLSTGLPLIRILTRVAPPASIITPNISIWLIKLIPPNVTSCEVLLWNPANKCDSSSSSSCSSARQPTM